MAEAAPSDEALAATMLRLLHARAADASVCPSEVARVSAEDWRPLMPQVRAVADALARQGRLVVTQGGQVVDALAAIGPIRLRLPPE